MVKLYGVETTSIISAQRTKFALRALHLSPRQDRGESQVKLFVKFARFAQATLVLHWANHHQMEMADFH